jgi:hypothetical protein
MTLAQTIVDTLHALRAARRERDVYREIALCAIHRLHDQSAQIAKQRTRLRRLESMLRRRNHHVDRVA